MTWALASASWSPWPQRKAFAPERSRSSSRRSSALMTTRYETLGPRLIYIYIQYIYKYLNRLGEKHLKERGFVPLEVQAGISAIAVVALQLAGSCSSVGALRVYAVYSTIPFNRKFLAQVAGCCVGEAEQSRRLLHLHRSHRPQVPSRKCFAAAQVEPPKRLAGAPAKVLPQGTAAHRPRLEA